MQRPGKSSGFGKDQYTEALRRLKESIRIATWISAFPVALNAVYAIALVLERDERDFSIETFIIMMAG
ncbi:hypothetical protein JXA40_08395 [bacterium]|nr:hypothetical protein [candidate division CSSED10-310 bacterium]